MLISPNSVTQRCTIIIIFFVIMLITLCSTKYIEGTLNMNQNWAFLTRFCMLSEIGELRFEMQYPKEFEVQNLYLYYDDPDQWPSVYKKNKTCKQKEGVLSVQNHQILQLSASQEDPLNEPNCKEEVVDKRTWLFCSHSVKFTSHRERWWFLALGNCENSSKLYLRYKIWMTNGMPDDFWFFQFSADEFYVLPTDLAFLCINLMGFILALYLATLLKQRHMFHTTYKLFLNSLGLECLGLLLLCVANVVYAKNGIGLPLFKQLGNMAEVASLLVFQFTLILIAKGYTITRGKLSKRSTVRISLFMTIYTFTYTAVFIYQARFFDPGLVTYLYESFPGYCMIATRLLGWIWFCYAIYFTLIHYPEKRRFYSRFVLFYSIWFWTTPILIIFANNFIGKWMREKIVNGVEKTLICVGYTFFLILTRPSAANSNFPYHVRVNQIGSLDTTAISDHPNVQEHLPHHLYELDAGNVIFNPSHKGSVQEQSANVLAEAQVVDASNKQQPAHRTTSVTMDDF